MADIGRIYSRTEAESQFGAVRNSVELPVAELEIFLEKAGKNIMFNIKNGKLIILDSRRNVLFPDGENIDEKEVCHLYSVSMVKQLIDRNIDQKTLMFENREKAFTVSGDNLILEFSTDCPPNCE